MQLDRNFRRGKIGPSIVSDRLLVSDLTFAKVARALYLPDWQWHVTENGRNISGGVVGINMGIHLGLRAIEGLEQLIERAFHRPAVVTVVARDDPPIPNDDFLVLWCALTARLASKGVTLRLFVQNMAQLAEGLASPYPIGIFEDRALEAFLNSPGGRLASHVSQRSELLMCWGINLHWDARQSTVATLVRNGFRCHAPAQLHGDPEEQPSTFAAAVFRNYSGGWVRASAGSRTSDHLWRYYSALVHSKFVIAPYGRGRDSYRFWEAVACGAIPVMLRDGWHQLDRSKYEGLPILLVDDWRMVSPSFLQHHWELMSSQEFDVRRLHSPFWLHELTAGLAAPLPNRRSLALARRAACQAFSSRVERTLVAPASWLAGAARGHCGVTVPSDGHNCFSGTRGSLGLTREQSRSWETAAAACLAKCAACARCRHVTVSLQYADCSWYHDCEKVAPEPAFRSAAVSLPHR